VRDATPADSGSTTPTTAQLSVWRDFLRLHATVIRRLEAELETEQDLSLGSYDVLVQLAEADRHRLRMSELAGRVLLSRSGLTRLIDRLVRDGLVVREPVTGDARGAWAVLTGDGLARLRQASRTHLRGVRRHMVGLFESADYAQLGELMQRSLVRAERSGEPVHGTPQPLR